MKLKFEICVIASHVKSPYPPIQIFRTSKLGFDQKNFHFLNFRFQKGFGLQVLHDKELFWSTSKFALYKMN